MYNVHMLGNKCFNYLGAVMKVADLIVELLKLDQNLPVYVNDHAGQIEFEVDVVEDDSDSTKLVCVLA